MWSRVHYQVEKVRRLTTDLMLAGSWIWTWKNLFRKSHRRMWRFVMSTCVHLNCALNLSKSTLCMFSNFKLLWVTEQCGSLVVMSQLFQQPWRWANSTLTREQSLASKSNQFEFKMFNLFCFSWSSMIEYWRWQDNVLFLFNLHSLLCNFAKIAFAKVPLNYQSPLFQQFNWSSYFFSYIMLKYCYMFKSFCVLWIFWNHAESMSILQALLFAKLSLYFIIYWQWLFTVGHKWRGISNSSW